MGYKLNKHGLFSPTWAWRNGDVKLILNELKHCEPPVVHVCSGSSSIGDIRIDRVKVNSNQHSSHGHMGCSNVIGNMVELPLKNNCAGTVICDPPYDIKGIDHQVFKDLISELTRILKPGGKMIYIAPWIPRHKNDFKILKIHPLPIGLRSKNTYYKVLTILQKSKIELDDYLQR